MSEPKLISPMLDHFAIGGAISTHHGVSCYPAMDNDFNDKYIVKILSVPASQTQLDALLLTGAYSSLESALSYFKEKADDICTEVKILEKLSQMEGFLPYRACQCELKGDGSGYDVYLLSPYRRTLTKQFVREPLTQLDVLNLGLDMCAALSASRRAGFLYVDLKPNNIYITSEKRFYIGDLGFIRLDSLPYASLPEKYLSEYNPPEIQDAFSTLNSTLDIYALGLILYQAYNNGDLPVAAADGSLTPPAYADYEMAGIIMKALSADPADRWQDPALMGQALVGYMQRNGANDTPIISVKPAETVLPSDAENPEPDDITGRSAEEDTDVTDSAKDTELSEEVAEEVQKDADVILEQPADGGIAPISDGMPADQLSSEDDESYINLSFLDDDETVAEDADLSYDDLSSELSDMLTLADELADHAVPDPVIAPEPIDVPMPEPITIVDPVNGDTSDNADAVDELDLTEDQDGDESSNVVAGNTENEENTVASTSKKGSRWLRGIIAILIIAALITGGYYYYRNYYLQNVESVSLSGVEDRLTVAVVAAIKDSSLYVVCTDPHGNKVTAPVENGKAEFTELLPNTAYSVSVEVNGFHQLTGNTAATYSTPQQTNIVQLSAVTGSEDGSVIIGFTVEGPDSEKWSVSYGTDGEEPELASFPGHTVSLNGLTVGKEYTFTLIPGSDLYLTGMEQIRYVASELIYAENLQFTSCVNNALTVSWAAPEGIAVSSWTVRCNGDDYSQSITTEVPTATFEGVDNTKSYVVEVIASGMSVSQRIQKDANAVTITDFSADDSIPGQLTLRWDASAEISSDGWILRTSVNGVEVYSPVICTENSAVLEGVIPEAQYVFTLEDLNGTQFIGVPAHFTSGSAEGFSREYDGFTITGEDITFRMCKTPNDPDWNRYDLHNDDYRNAYDPGENASFLMHFEKKYGNSSDRIAITFVITDTNGTPVSVSTQTKVWNNMWYRYYGELDIPALPSAAGTYTIATYFDGALVNAQDFTINE